MTDSPPGRPPTGVLAQTPAPGMDELTDLQALDGVDVMVGLAAVGGRISIYRRLLARFIQTHEFEAPVWDASLVAGRPADARQRVHAVRGAASTLGLIGIDEAARRLESALAAGADSHALGDLSAELAREIADGIAGLRTVPGVLQAFNDLSPAGR